MASDRSMLVVSAHSAPISSGAPAARSRCMRARLRDERGLPVLRRARRVGQAVAAAGHDAGASQGERQKEAEAAARSRRRESSSSTSATTRCAPTSALRLVDVYRDIHPAFVLTHSLADPYNFDHPPPAQMAQEARIIAQAHGHNPAGARRAAGIPVRAAPARAVRLEARRAARHHVRVGQEARGHRVHGGPGAPVGVLHAGGLQRGVQAARNAAQGRQNHHARRLRAIFPQSSETLA